MTTSRTPSLACALLCFLVVYLMVKATATVSVSVSRPSGFVRQRRSLTFPYGFDESYLEFIFGVGLPMDLPHPYQVLMSIEIRADYRYPVNASDFTNPTLRGEEKEKEKEEKEEKKKKATLKSDGVVADVTKTRSGGDNARIEGGTNTTDKKLNSPKHGEDEKGIVRVVTTRDNVDKNSTDEINNISSGRGEDASRHVDAPDNNAPGNESKIDLNQSPTSEFDNNNNNTGGLRVNISEPLQAVDFENKDATANTTADDLDLDAPEESVARYINKRDAHSGSTRWRIYHIIEMAANNLGMDGRACLLRSICDAAATPLNHRSNGLVGELVHVLLTPSTTNDDRGRYQVNEYHSAERLGAQVGNKCRLLFPECDVSFLDLITQFDL